MDSTGTTVKEVGSTWVWSYHGKDWPVILCDYQTPPRIFITTRRPTEIPALLLGKRKFIWVTDDARLQAMDPFRDYFEGLPCVGTTPNRDYDAEVSEEKLRKIAFREDAPASHTLGFWKNFIDNRRAARATESEIANKYSHPRRKRNYGDDDDIDEVEIVGVRPISAAGSTPKTVSKRRSDREDSKAQLLKPGPTPSKRGLGKQRERPIITPNGDNDDYDDSSLFVEEANMHRDPSSDSHRSKLQKLRQDNEQSAIDNRPGIELCTIFVGNTKKPFQVPSAAVACSSFLSDQIHFTEALGSHIDLSDDREPTEEDFSPVWEYMHNNDFRPQYIDRRRPGSFPHLDGVIDADDRDKAAKLCGCVFRTASMLQLEALQSLAVDKLKALYPLSPLMILIVARCAQDSEHCMSDAKDELLAWLVDHVGDYYYQLITLHGKQLAEMLSRSPSFEQSVADRVARNPQACKEGMEDD
ncbi:hypothetical protein LTR08_001323 [Meristemomyces frigidus]|nr:hypothetical protein LTR08_001323 [Meristemomyces frigidus]